MQWGFTCLTPKTDTEENAINELFKQVAKAALITVVPILIQAFIDRFLDDEELWMEYPEDDE